MSTSSTTLRLITLLFLLAGILLLRKPVFGQTSLTSQQIHATILCERPPVNIIESILESQTISAHRISIRSDGKSGISGRIASTPSR
ncbi:MAG TPA: hypothetical protein VK684_15210 [Edaphobacter sp.]|jgi:hypothetical protein|nr:hypothetical protein [Edaphobacter sp.]